jgi:hypothetical protein
MKFRKSVLHFSSSSSSWALQPRVGLGLLKTTPPSGTVKGDIFPVSNTDVVEIFFKPSSFLRKANQIVKFIIDFDRSVS